MGASGYTGAAGELSCAYNDDQTAQVLSGQITCTVVDCNACNYEYLLAGGCEQGASVDMSTDCTTCEKTICQSTETLFCTECKDAADAASLTDECVQTTSYMCNAGTLTEDYCKDCDFSAAITEACFTTVSPGVDHICDKPQAVQFSLAMGLTADTFTDEVKNELLAELVKVMNKDATVVSADDMTAELDTGR